MLHRLALLIGVIGLLLGPFQVHPAASQRAPTVDVPGGDPEMRAAIAQARKTLTEFWTALDTPDPSLQGFALKVGLPTAARSGMDVEHIWINSIERLGDNRFAGKLGNEPRGIKGRRMGDRVEFGEAQISDWMFMRNGRMVGNETVRPLLARMPKAQADRVRAMMEKP